MWKCKSGFFKQILKTCNDSTTYSVVNSRLAHFQCWNLMMLQQKTAQKLCKNAPYCWRVGIMLIILFGINFLIDGSFGWKISSLRMLLWLTWLRKKVDNNLWNFVEHGGDDLGIIMRFFFFKYILVVLDDVADLRQDF